MKKRIIGGIITLVIGGSLFTLKETDIVNNFSKNTGMTEQQAQKYVDNLSENDLDSFSSIGQSYIKDGNFIVTEAEKIDCVNYAYDWESSSLSCLEGKEQLQSIGENEIKLGECYTSLDTDLGDSTRSKISECISDTDDAISDLDLPVISILMDTEDIADNRNTYAYNKSVLEAALESEQ